MHAVRDIVMGNRSVCLCVRPSACLSVCLCPMLVLCLNECTRDIASHFSTLC